MRDFLTTLHTTVKTYKSSANHVSLFREISDYHYRENYHSDILAFYLRFNEAKSELIAWLNARLADKNESINYDEYASGAVEREEGRVDILLYSSNRKKAIVIENKSNDAIDQPRQLFGYYDALRKAGVIVEAVFYLNKTSLKEPDYAGLTARERDELREVLVVGRLVEKDSFTENVLHNVIQKTRDIRLNALSREIEDLFNWVIYGDINMADLENFVKALSGDDNVGKLKKIMEAYNDIPEFLVHKYLNYVTIKNTGYKIWIYKKTTLVVDIKSQTGVQYAFDVCFSVNVISFQLFARNRGGESGTEEELLVALKEAAGGLFPFKEPLSGGRYRLNIENILDDGLVKKIFDDLLELGKKYIE